MNILLVDGEPTFLVEMLRFLERRGHTVFSASSALRGRKYLERQEIDLVITGRYIPTPEHGAVFVAFVKAVEQLPVVVLSALLDASTISRFTALGADVCIDKADVHYPAKVLAFLEEYAVSCQS